MFSLCSPLMGLLKNHGSEKTLGTWQTPPFFLETKKSCSKNIWVGYHEYDASTASSSTLHRFQLRHLRSPVPSPFVRGLTGSKKGETLSIFGGRSARATYLRYSAQFICHPCSEKDLGEFSCTVNIDVSRNGEKKPKRHSNVCWSENYI